MREDGGETQVRRRSSETLLHTHTIKGRVTEKRDLDIGGEVGTDRIEYQPYFMLKGKRVRLKVGGGGVGLKGDYQTPVGFLFSINPCLISLSKHPFY